MTQWTGRASHVEENTNAHNVLFRVPEIKKLVGRSTIEWENNLNINFKEICRWLVN
jgi:hypothetical protein